jgi:hypothetical protein
MLSLHKWYPFVFPTPYDVKSIAFEKRVERLQYEYDEALKAQKVRNDIEAFALELYNKRANQHKLELEIFNNHRHFDKYA